MQMSSTYGHKETPGEYAARHELNERNAQARDEKKRADAYAKQQVREKPALVADVLRKARLVGKVVTIDADQGRCWLKLTPSSYITKAEKLAMFLLGR